jgi:hypothetical protein
MCRGEGGRQTRHPPLPHSIRERARPRSSPARPPWTSTRRAGSACSDACSAKAKQASARDRSALSEVVPCESAKLDGRLFCFEPIVSNDSASTRTLSVAPSARRRTVLSVGPGTCRGVNAGVRRDCPRGPPVLGEGEPPRRHEDSLNARMTRRVLTRVTKSWRTGSPTGRAAVRWTRVRAKACSSSPGRGGRSRQRHQPSG